MTEPHKYVPALGEIIRGEAQRDAVHIAVAPIIAGEMLRPGQHVSAHYDHERKRYVAKTSGATCGVVDPYLRRPAFEGDTVWVLLYPGTITGLRHEWTHPGFQT
jgi:hypothetical protein